MFRLLIPLAVAVVLAFAPAGCKKDKPFTDHAGGKVLARVNSTAITEGDLTLWAGGAHGKKLPPEMKARLLDNLIDLELLYEKGVALGLNKDPDYLARRAKLKDNVKVFDRIRIKRLVVEKEIQPKVNVTEESARKYFDEHRGDIQAQWRLHYIKFPTGEMAEAALAQIRGGVSFNDVVKGLGAGGASRHQVHSQDLGFLSWAQIPPQWREAVFKLKPGEVSDVVRSPREGIRILKLIAKKPDPDVKFDTLKDMIIAQLRTQGLEEAAEAYVSQLRKDAKIERYDKS